MPYSLTLLVIVLSWPQVAIPDTAPDGSKLLRACSAARQQQDGRDLSVEDAAEALWCVGYVGGFIDGLAVAQWGGGVPRVCLPERGVEVDQRYESLKGIFEPTPSGFARAVEQHWRSRSHWPSHAIGHRVDDGPV